MRKDQTILVVAALTLLGTLSVSASDAFRFRESFDDFDPAPFRTKIPNKNTEVRDGVLWTRGASGGKYPPMVYLDVAGKNLDISFRYRHLEDGGMVWFFVDGDDGFGSVDHMLRVKLNRRGIQLQIDAHSLDPNHPDRQNNGRPADKVSGAYRLNKKLPQESVDLSANVWRQVKLAFRGDTVSLSVDGETWSKELKHACFNATKRKLLWMQNGGGKGIEIDDIEITEIVSAKRNPAGKRAAITAEKLPGDQTARLPNILVILADDMPRHHPGFNGGPVSTPNLDRLAREGTQLTEFYVHSVCSPTRAAFLTGRYPFRTGMEERSHGNDVAGMLTDERTLAEALQEAGYFTAIIGKWHLGNWHKRHLPMQRGFDYQYGLYGALIGYYGKTRERYYDWHRNEQTLREEGYSTDLIGRECSRVIASHKGKKPMFLYVPFNAVHGPDEAPPELKQKYEAILQKQSGDLPPSQQRFLTLKYAMLESMDRAIGKILDALETRGELDNTLIVFFNDNGGRKNNPPYRGGKGDTFEGGVRVPCLIRWLGKVPANRSIDGMMHDVDLYPTLLNQASGSLEQKLPLDGMDLWEVITGDKESPRTEVVHSLPGEHSDTGVMSIRQGRYKLVGEELFDIEQDPAETTDLAAKHPGIYQSLRKRIQELAKERRLPEVHTNITRTIDTPLLVFGKEENENPPSWLPPHLKELPMSEKELRKLNARSKRKSKGN